MYYLRELEERIDEYRRQVEELELLPEDRDVLQSIQDADSGTSLKARVASVLVQLGFKVDPDAAYASAHEAA